MSTGVMDEARAPVLAAPLNIDLSVGGFACARKTSMLTGGGSNGRVLSARERALALLPSIGFNTPVRFASVTGASTPGTSWVDNFAFSIISNRLGDSLPASRFAA